jgi:hypothetical protein
VQKSRLTTKQCLAFFRACDLELTAIEGYGRSILASLGLASYFKLGMKFVDLCDFCDLTSGATYSFLLKEIVEMRGLCREIGKLRAADGPLEQMLATWEKEAATAKGEIPPEHRTRLKAALQAVRPILER